ncbi:hypothetical protein LZ31DRAFT_546297 [Colletotrichum somersetense]|nr:hypothetical protein LZ31DRAFT_546297 [Colletotrichum somersetense]
MPQLNVIIVGSSLAGPLLASGLLAADVKVDLYEKLAADVKRDGYQIRVAQPCLEAFHLSLSAEQNEEIKARLGHFELNEKATPIWDDHKLKPLLNMGRFSEQYHGSSPMDRMILRNTIM